MSDDYERQDNLTKQVLHHNHQENIKNTTKDSPFEMYKYYCKNIQDDSQKKSSIFLSKKTKNNLKHHASYWISLCGGQRRNQIESKQKKKQSLKNRFDMTNKAQSEPIGNQFSMFQLKHNDNMMRMNPTMINAKNPWHENKIFKHKFSQSAGANYAGFLPTTFVPRDQKIWMHDFLGGGQNHFDGTLAFDRFGIKTLPKRYRYMKSRTSLSPPKSTISIPTKPPAIMSSFIKISDPNRINLNNDLISSKLHPTSNHSHPLSASHLYQRGLSLSRSPHQSTITTNQHLQAQHNRLRHF